MEPKIKVTMLIASLGLSGTPRIMMDIIENINRDRFEVSVACKPEYPDFEDDLLIPLKELGIRTLPLRGEPLFSVKGISDLYNHVKKDSIDIIHCWDALGIAARIMRWSANIRVVESFGNPVTSKGSFLYYWVNKMTSAFLDGAIFESEGVEKSYLQSDVWVLKRRIKTRVIHNSIDSAGLSKKYYPKDRIRRKWQISGGDFLLTNAGVFNEQKAQSELLRALKILSNHCPNTKLILIGWGPKEEELKSSVIDINLQNNVLFTGKLSHEEVYEVLSITDVFVLSSLWEGFGLVIGEAMAMGKPVVATRTDGSELLVVDRETGFLVPPRDPVAMSNAIQVLINNRDLCHRMGESGQKRIATLCHPDRFIREHEEFYMDILGRDH